MSVIRVNRKQTANRIKQFEQLDRKLIRFNKFGEPKIPRPKDQDWLLHSYDEESPQETIQSIYDQFSHKEQLPVPMTKSHKFYHPPNSSPKMRPSLFLKDEVLKPEDKSLVVSNFSIFLQSQSQDKDSYLLHMSQEKRSPKLGSSGLKKKGTLLSSGKDQQRDLYFPNDSNSYCPLLSSSEERVRLRKEIGALPKIWQETLNRSIQNKRGKEIIYSHAKKIQEDIEESTIHFKPFLQEQKKRMPHMLEFNTSNKPFFLIANSADQKSLIDKIKIDSYQKKDQFVMIEPGVIKKFL